MKKIISIILVIPFLLIGCSSNDYSKVKKEFYETYFEIAKSIDGKDSDSIKEVLLTEESIEKIGKLKKLLDECNEYTNSDTKKEKDLGIDTKKRMYEDMAFLQNAYSRFDKLSFGEKREIGIILVRIGLDLMNWEDRESSIRWP